MKSTLHQIIFICIIAPVCFLSRQAFAQDSSHLRISLITCGPGAPDDELYTTFGHTGIRIVDSSNMQDAVYNYGTFDAFEDNFYLNFIKGRLRYYVAMENFKDFEDYYQAANRSMTEQVLNLTNAEKKAVRNFLNNNIQVANRYYQYDFCFDNCTTRVRDIFKKNHDSAFTKYPAMPSGTTFRQAIYFCLDRNDQQWSKLGIDLLLGKPCDAVMTAEQMEFLPDNLMKNIDSANHPFVLSKNNLYPVAKNNYKVSFFSPLVVFAILLLVIIAISFLKPRFAQIFLQGFDGLFFFITGLTGILLIFMWFFTDHIMTKENFNLLWAWPTHAAIAFFVNSKKQWVKKYFAFTAAAMIIVLLAWFFLPQHLNSSLIVICLLLLFRSLSKYMSI